MPKDYNISKVRPPEYPASSEEANKTSTRHNQHSRAFKSQILCCLNHIPDNPHMPPPHEPEGLDLHKIASLKRPVEAHGNLQEDRQGQHCA